MSFCIQACMPRASWMLSLHESTLAYMSVSIQKQSPFIVRTCSRSGAGSSGSGSGSGSG